jgi:putative tricarboxylic transport membrane protein
MVLLHTIGFALASGDDPVRLHRRGLWRAAFSHPAVPAGFVLGLFIYGVFDQLLKLNLPGGPIENLIFGG